MRGLITAGLVVLLLAVGALAVVAGEADDSPGLQLIGVVVLVLGLGVGVRLVRRHPRSRRTR